MPGPLVLVVDGNSLVHRSFHAQAHTGQPDWAVRGLLTQLVAAVDRIRPDQLIVGFDDPTSSLRRDRWPAYKAGRTEKLPALVEQLAHAVDVLRALGIAVVMPPGLEADDVLASVAAHGHRVDGTTVIVTSDRDAFALIDDRTRVLRVINGGVDASPIMTAERLVTLLGVTPTAYRDYAALRGDPSDNLNGVRGIGPRKAAQLLAEFGSAAVAFADLDGVRSRLGAGVATCLSHPDAHPAWSANCQVMAMHDDVPVGPLLADGLGALPLDAATVGAIFRAHNLVWSVSQAVRVLADAEWDDGARPAAVLEPWPPTTPAPRRLPALPRRVLVEQLALFD